MLGHLFRKEARDRYVKITALVKQLDELLQPVPNGSQVDLIKLRLSALRLLQAEDRLANNLLIAVLSAVGGGVFVYMSRLF